MMFIPFQSAGVPKLLKITFIAPDGTEHVVAAAPGSSVMQAAVANGVPGIVGECGGNLSCATCHVWVSDQFFDAVGPAEGIEDDMLDLGVSDRRPNSRLGCQVELVDDLDGLMVEVPPEQ